MSGWRLGWLVLPEGLIAPVNSLQQNMFINAPTISQTAALACWDPDTIAVLEQHVKKYATSRSVILEELAKVNELNPKNIAPGKSGAKVAAHPKFLSSQ